MNWVENQPVQFTIGPFWNIDGTPKTDLTIIDLGVYLYNPSGTAVYSKAEGAAAPVDPDVQVTLIHLGQGLYLVTFTPDAAGHWSILVLCVAYGKELPGDFDVLTEAAAAVTPSTNADYLGRVRELLDDTCPAPSISLLAASGGSLAAGVLNIRVSSLTLYGESLPCARVTATVALNNKVTVTITNIKQARGFRIYASQVGAETLQGEVAVSSSGSASFVISSVAAGSAMPGTDSGTVHIEQASYARVIAAAADEYSQNYPRAMTATVNLVVGTQKYDLPADWEEGFSSISQLQYPVADYPPIYLDAHHDFFEKDGQWCFRYLSPSVGEQAKLYYTKRHTVDATTNSIPVRHFEAVCLIAAGQACDMVAARYAHQSNKAIAADVVDYKMRSEDFAKKGKAYRASAWDMLGMPGGVMAASGWAEWEYYREHGTVAVT